MGSKNAAGHGAPKENKNAVGNRGGPGGPPGNKKAVTTGEFETIWLDCLTEKEQVLCDAINTDTLAQVDEDIRLMPDSLIPLEWVERNSEKKVLVISIVMVLRSTLILKSLRKN